MGLPVGLLLAALFALWHSWPRIQRAIWRRRAEAYAAKAFSRYHPLSQWYTLGDAEGQLDPLWTRVEYLTSVVSRDRSIPKDMKYLYYEAFTEEAARIRSGLAPTETDMTSNTVVAPESGVPLDRVRQIFAEAGYDLPWVEYEREHIRHELIVRFTVRSGPNSVDVTTHTPFELVHSQNPSDLAVECVDALNYLGGFSGLERISQGWPEFMPCTREAIRTVLSQEEGQTEQVTYRENRKYRLAVPLNEHLESVVRYLRDTNAIPENRPKAKKAPKATPAPESPARRLRIRKNHEH